MNDDATAGQISASAAEIYDDFFVPALFGPWAGPLCEIAGLSPGARALDVACGTGATTRVAHDRVRPGGGATGLDRNAGMLAVARRKAPGIDWVEGRAENLPFADDSFDAALCQFGLMFFDDRAAALWEMRRVVRPGGRIAVSVWDDVRNSPGYAGMIALLERLFGPAPAEALRAPFVLGDAAALRGLAAESGAPDAKVVTREGVARFPSIRDWVATDVRGWTLADMIDDDQFAALVEAAEREFADFTGPDGRVAFAAPAHVLMMTGAG